MTLATTAHIVAALATPTTVRDLAAQLGVTRRTVERQLAALEDAGTRIARTRDRKDRRVVWLRLQRGR